MGELLVFILHVSLVHESIYILY